jgi:2,3-bisphosphoglycerate-independent phosphoglycerate mutase
LQTTAPHDIPGEPIRKRLPVGGEHAGLLHKLIAESQVMLEGHEVNRTRREMGELPATHLWPWGQGKRPQMPAFTKRFGIRACMITAVDLLAGIAACTGIQRLDVPGQTSFHDTDYAAAGHHGVAALDTHDLVIVHIEAPDEAAHASDAVTKRDAIAAIDAHVVGPLREALEARDEPWRMLVLPDHYTLTATRKHDATPPPFVLAGHNIRSVVQAPYAEQHAEEADLHITRGHDLMEYFLRSGL